MIEKAKAAFRTISEAADELGVPQHVLRFWETKFAQVKPLKRGGNRRYYRPEDLNLLHAIKHQLYDEGHSIKEVQAMMREEGLKDFVEGWLETLEPAAPEPEAVETPKQTETPAKATEPEQAREFSLKDDNTIQVSKDLVRALVSDLKALRQLIDRLPD